MAKMSSQYIVFVNMFFVAADDLCGEPEYTYNFQKILVHTESKGGFEAWLCISVAHASSVTR